MELDERLMGLAETDILVTARSGEQERVPIERALKMTTIELANIKVNSDWINSTYIIRRPLFRMYAPISVRFAAVSPGLDIQIALDSDRVKSHAIRHKNQDEKLMALIGILRTANEKQLNRIADEQAKLVELQAQVLQIKHIAAESYLYPISIKILAGTFTSLCEALKEDRDTVLARLLDN